jgi:hypothetical protein
VLSQNWFVLHQYIVIYMVMDEIIIYLLFNHFIDLIFMFI